MCFSPLLMSETCPWMTWKGDIPGSRKTGCFLKDLVCCGVLMIVLAVDFWMNCSSGWQPRWGYGKMLIVVADRDRNSKMNRWTRLWPLIARVRRQVDCVQRSNKGILFEWWVKVAYLNVHLILSRACDSEIQIKVWHLDNVPVSPLYPWKSNASYLPPKKAFASEISNMEDSPVWGW